MTKESNGNWIPIKDLKDKDGNFIHCGKKFKTVKDLMTHMTTKHPNGAVMITIGDPKP